MSPAVGAKGQVTVVAEPEAELDRTAHAAGEAVAVEMAEAMEESGQTRLMLMRAEADGVQQAEAGACAVVLASVRNANA